MQTNCVIHGDSLKVLKGFEDNSLDSIVTDPPYGINFMGKEWDKALPSVDIWKECIRVLKPGSFAFVMSLPRQDCLARMIINLEDAGFNVSFTPLYWCFASGFPKAANIGKMIDRRADVVRKGITKKGVGQETGYHRKYKQKYETGNPIPEEAKTLDGSYAGFSPKPATEVILVAMKPLEQKMYVDQALNNGKGITWLDDCRIPFKNGSEGSRFPANLLVSDDVLNDGIERKSGNIKSWHNRTAEKTNGIYGKFKTPGFSTRDGDSGSFSRYFDLDIWFAEQIKKLPDSVQKTFPHLIVSKPSKKERTMGGNVENKHPTVKPIKLIAYLITLGSRPGDIILDPFAGSGTTACACDILNRKWIIIEQNEKTVETAKQRIKYNVY